MKDETLNSTQAWLGSLPGHVYANVRRPDRQLDEPDAPDARSAACGRATRSTGTSRACAASARRTSTAARPARRPFACTWPSATSATRSSSGRRAAGKSTLLGMLALGWLKYPGAQVIVFDKDRSARAATLAVGGTCYEPGKETRAGRLPAARRHRPAGRARLGRAVRRHAARRAGRARSTTGRRPPSTRRSRASRPRRASSGRSRSSRRRSDRASGRCAMRCGPTRSRATSARSSTPTEDDVRAGGFWTMIEMGHLMAMGPGGRPSGARVPLSPGRAAVRRAADAAHPGRGVALSQPRGLRDAAFRRGSRRCARRTSTSSSRRRRWPTPTSKPELLSTILSACHTKIFLPDDEALTPAMTAAYQAVGLTTRRGADPRQGAEEARLLLPVGQGPAALRARSRARRRSPSSARRASTTSFSR